MDATRRGVLAAVGATLGATLAAPARAAERVPVGVLRFVSSGGLFLAKELGFFAEAGIEPDFVFFDAAQPIAVAVASGDVAFGATSITAGTLNLGGKGAVAIIGSQGAERRGYKGSTFLASAAAHARGLTGLGRLSGASIAVTQVGSSQHYMAGRAAAAHGIELSQLTIRPLQSVPNMIAALRGGQVDATILPPQFARPLVERGEARHLGYFSEVADYQYGALMTAPRLLTESRPLVQRFAAAYARGAAAYAASLLRLDANGDTVVDAQARQAASLLAKYVMPNDRSEGAADAVLAAVVYVDPSARINPADIAEQVRWFKAQRLVAPGVDPAAFVDPSFAA